jgi:hypothetical protein
MFLTIRPTQAVYAEYTVILSEGKMKQYLNACIYVSEILTRQKKWMTMWKKINLYARLL